MEEIMAEAIKGSIIAEIKFSTVYYYRKCESCGYVSSSKYVADLRFCGDTYRHSFKCPKCGNQQDIEVRDI